ncbi:hypothetical protein N7931_00165 [Catenovulum sp. 2E275]|uniref:hypothetical protein n=1 Tax=Catenovulum sp. 2E275 TaxID=2980497 RepID=UPI0021D2002C|nr:hypothetical protein [Catenovulum sp. 2E275]MCU4674034.1 hypothetical protein [Catenovulum sp. 2E275]
MKLLKKFWISLLFSQISGAYGNDWIKIDTFEESENIHSWHQIDTKNETRPFINNPQITEIKTENANNKYLLKKPAENGVIGNRKALTFKKLPMPVQVGEIYTFYTRINVESFPNNHAFGLSNLDKQGIINHDYNAFEPTLRVTDKTESSGLVNTGALMVKTDQGYANIINPVSQKSAKPLQTNTWYEIWYIVNNSPKSQGGQTYDVFMKGGAEFPNQTQVYHQATFRMKREQTLTHFLMNCNTGPHNAPYGNGGLKYDDIFMARGVNLLSPKELNNQSF